MNLEITEVRSYLQVNRINVFVFQFHFLPEKILTFVFVPLSVLTINHFV